MGEEIRYRNPVKSIGFAQIYHVATLDSELSDGAFRTYALYLMYAQQDEKCWPGRPTIAEKRDKGDSTIGRHNDELEALGYITRDRRFGKTSITWIEDMETVPRLKGIAESLKNERSDRSKMSGRIAQKWAAEEEPIEEESTEETPPDDDFQAELWYKDRDVKVVGTRSKGPWSVECSHCRGEIVISSLNEWTPCICGMREYLLLKGRPKAKIDIHPAVLAYSRASKVSISRLKEEQIKLIEETVGTKESDIAFWKEVIRGWIITGWYELNVGGMLDWFVNKSVPGKDKKKRSDEQSAQFYDAHEAHYGKLEQTPLPEGTKIVHEEVLDENGRLVKVIQKRVKV